jgi:hypothetical protein
VSPGPAVAATAAGVHALAATREALR